MLRRTLATVEAGIGLATVRGRTTLSPIAEAGLIGPPIRIDNVQVGNRPERSTD